MLHKSFRERIKQTNQMGKASTSNSSYPLTTDYNWNLQILKSIYENCSDVTFRSFLIKGEREATLIYIEGLTNLKEMDSQVLTPLMEWSEAEPEYMKEILKKKITVSTVKDVGQISECVQSISNGLPILIIDGEDRGFSFGLSKWEKRNVEEPAAEAVIRGSREGFTETLGVNRALLRRRIKSPDLKSQSMKIGDYTQTDVVILFIKGIADQALIEEVTKRIERIQIDGILSSGYIEEFITDDPYSPFPQVLSTERPDVTAACLLEGRVAILVDGTPFTLIVPMSLFSLIQSPEDYSQNYLISTALRLLRYFSVGVSLLLPSFYVAILTFHQEMLPTSLMISIASSHEPVPFPALIEALIMEITFEALREAGIRLPKQIGSAVSIVGGLVIGQAAVQAGLISAPMVIVVSITGVASFTIPRYIMGLPFRLLRFPMIILAGTLGMLGVMLGILMISIHLCCLRSFGIPYLSPFAPAKVRDMKDTVIRAPWWAMDTRPSLTGEGNLQRQKSSQKPGPKWDGNDG